MGTKRQNIARTLIQILLFGSIWGSFEVVLDSGLRTINFPYRAGSLVGIGMLSMGMALAIYKRPSMLIGIGLIAGSFKLLSVPILHIPLSCKANSFIAIGLQAFVLSLVTGSLIKKMDKSIHTRMGVGGLAALVSAAGFYFIGMRVAPCPYLLSFSPLGFMVREGIIWAIFSAIMLPLGYLVGIRLRQTMVHLLTTRPTFGYAACISISAVCVGISAITIVAVG
ncbi:hypothetical protein CH333_10070 [candidate division WOR-3 bacterium JGI_Cruoil_03_44_89]|uniref:Uncharacterized protein n=1 Tax=candidate division WOR-3 bacterium JGI_Cruoil_03_44_89 TaxID=1973748 RepID=A0A235BMR0_UNCW3|nr:MAG: hypothetical protein CH333_10070 [candidate division WOR-3 bacterium JGI_Cruoil_03_44_89]